MASQPKIPRTDADNVDVGPEIDHEILESVDGVQEAIDSLNKKASVEILKVEQKFNKLRKPHYEARAELLSKIPNFWLTVFMNHVQLRKSILPEDEKVLASLKAVEVQEFDDITSGYKINFIFDENEYFTNTVITKEYHVGEKGDPTSTSTKIDWKPGMDLTQGKDNGNDDQKREYPMPSFFCWFVEDGDAVGDFIGESIKDELWPNPLQFYLNPDMDSDDVEDDDEDDEEDDEDEDGGDINYDEIAEQGDVPKSS